MKLKRQSRRKKSDKMRGVLGTFMEGERLHLDF